MFHESSTPLESSVTEALIENKASCSVTLFVNAYTNIVEVSNTENERMIYLRMLRLIVPLYNKNENAPGMKAECIEKND